VGFDTFTDAAAGLLSARMTILRWLVLV